jgi:hypothetical protein
MARVRVSFVFGFALMAGVAGRPASAQTPAVPAVAQVQSVPAPAEVQRVREELERLRKEFESLRRVYDDRLIQLEQRLAQIGGGPLALSPESAVPAQAVPPPAAPPPQPQQTTDPAPQAPQAAPGSSKVFNPDISVNGNFIAAAGRNPFATLSPMQLSEVEAAFQAVVDPYARADFFLAAGPDGLEVEEGYATFTSLPGSILLKVGKMRAQFGKMNTLHTHSLPTVDRSLVTDNLVGGEEGLSDAGFSVSHLVKNPYLFLELTGEVFAGISEVFQSDERSKLVYLGRIRGYRDINESSNLDIGFSYTTGPTRVEVEPELLSSGTARPTLSAVGLTKHLYGIDATFRYRPLRRAIYQRLNLRTELIWSQQQMPDAASQHAFGMYASGEYQFARRWYIGGRGDRSGRTLEASAIDTGGSVFLTFWPTEFSQIRGQFRRINFAGGEKGNEFLMQFNFSIGAHGAHLF